MMLSRVGLRSPSALTGCPLKEMSQLPISKFSSRKAMRLLYKLSGLSLDWKVMLDKSITCLQEEQNRSAGGSLTIYVIY